MPLASPRAPLPHVGWDPQVSAAKRTNPTWPAAQTKGGDGSGLFWFIGLLAYWFVGLLVYWLGHYKYGEYQYLCNTSQIIAKDCFSNIDHYQLFDLVKDPCVGAAACPLSLSLSLSRWCQPRPAGASVTMGKGAPTRGHADNARDTRSTLRRHACSLWQCSGSCGAVMCACMMISGNPPRCRRCAPFHRVGGVGARVATKHGVLRATCMPLLYVCQGTSCTTCTRRRTAPSGTHWPKG